MIDKETILKITSPDEYIKSFGEKYPLLRMMRERFSVRSFSDREIEKEKIEAILIAGQIAPTAVNYQPQKIYILQSKEALKKVRRITKSTYNAPTVFLVCSDYSKSWHSVFDDNYDSGESDAAIVCTHMMLEAWEQGIGSVWVLLFDPKKVVKEFNLPNEIRPICLLALGYPTNDCTPYRPWHDTFRPLSDTVTVL